MPALTTEAEKTLAVTAITPPVPPPPDNAAVGNSVAPVAEETEATAKTTSAVATAVPTVAWAIVISSATA